MKTPFHYNVPRTFAQRLARAEQINRWIATVIWLVLAVCVIAVCKIVGRWL